MSGELQLAAVLTAVFAGAATQRVTGLGFGLVAAPFLVLLLGPFDGVLVSNLLGLTVSLVVLAVTWRDVDVRRVGLLAVPALLGVPAGAWVARRLPGPLLMVTVGTLVLVALLAVVSSRRARVFTGTRGAVSAGAMSGFMNASAGVGGPAVTLYALSTGWGRPTFVPSVQCYFALISAASLASKGMPSLPLHTLVLVLAVVAPGLAVGQLLTRWVSPDATRVLVVAVAITGAGATVVKGLVGL